MTTTNLRCNQIGKALQFQENGNTVTVEVGRVWFAATDTIPLSTAPGAINLLTVLLTAEQFRSSV
ncbi:MAG: hypothetical protein U1A24_08015 [Cypionkella sp.]|uniref:hypothetical protein n=1 Tax=Cypionkella sp. TaxID=2811411 RepID=UPI002AB91BB4|nr:hypothetical protein [Cypionkella sp.]MDZ4310489.1 hypothetical protein [Cypionkella sp.]MDZ4391729.1 hypothetical protein [Cypionkella sp.]